MTRSEIVYRGADLALWPLDWLRARWLSIWGTRFASLYRNRAKRMAITASLGVVVSLALTVWAPLILFTLGPVLIGVPHLVSDVRYLVVRPKLHRNLRISAAVGLPLLLLYWRGTADVGLVAALFAILASRGSWRRRVTFALGMGAVLWGATQNAWMASLAVTHLHNLVAIGMAFWVFAPHLRVGVVPTALYLAASTLILTGKLDPWLFRQQVFAMGWADAATASTSYALPTMDVFAAFRVLAWFVFSQSVHYACWLRAIPDAAREREGVRGFRSSFRALVGEMGWPFLVASAACSLAILALAWRSPEHARQVYLQLAGFHAYLEFAFLALLLADPSLRQRVRPT